MRNRLTAFVLFVILLCVWIPFSLASEAEKTEEPTQLEQARAALDRGDYETAIPIIRQAADAGDAQAQNWLGNCYSGGAGVEQNDEEAVKYYQLSADQGHIPAEYNLAMCYLEGSGVKQDAEKAEKLLKSCAERGDAQSQYALGYLYLVGESLKQDQAEAVKYFSEGEKAPAFGQAYSLQRAKMALGRAHERGEGVEKDLAKAA